MKIRQYNLFVLLLVFFNLINSFPPHLVSFLTDRGNYWFVPLTVVYRLWPVHNDQCFVFCFVLVFFVYYSEQLTVMRRLWQVWQRAQSQRPSWLALCSLQPASQSTCSFIMTSISNEPRGSNDRLDFNECWLLIYVFWSSAAAIK